jgi:septum formation topological specificity factor MinE
MEPEAVENMKKEFMEIVQNKVINGIDPLID